MLVQGLASIGVGVRALLGALVGSAIGDRDTMVVATLVGMALTGTASAIALLRWDRARKRQEPPTGR